MNYLAHLFLSGDSREIRIGNFIGDHVRGNDHENYPETIALGIRLHREIDRFSDNHSIFRQSVARLRPMFRKYAPVITDMFYDHFLASNWESFSNSSLSDFTEKVYTEIEEELPNLPLSVQHMFPYMMNSNWLLSYSSINGIHRALSGLARRTTFQSNMEYSSMALQEDYPHYAEEFGSFFPEMIEHARKFIEGKD